MEIGIRMKKRLFKYAEADRSLNTSEGDADVYTLTPEDEVEIDQAVDYYLAMEGFNPMMQARGFGKYWWKSHLF